MINQYDVFWTDLDPTRGSEMAKTRPCVVVSPKEIHDYMCTAIVIPITSTLQRHPCRVKCHIKNRDGEIATDQIKTVDKSRLGDFIGALSESEIKALRDSLKRLLCQ
ncbi:Endoribonuclease MazF [termite gut metagenome]|uniref:Endoribonuclease MazF n=1 Tax=termite gut metagenome TaxID=433724 RepID=A0A5J4SAG0_9ZZZZ